MLNLKSWADFLEGLPEQRRNWLKNQYEDYVKVLSCLKEGIRDPREIAEKTGLSVTGVRLILDGLVLFEWLRLDDQLKL